MLYKGVQASLDMRVQECVQESMKVCNARQCDGQDPDHTGKAGQGRVGQARANEVKPSDPDPWSLKSDVYEGGGIEHLTLLLPSE